jgi:hypothetical protein
VLSIKHKTRVIKLKRNSVFLKLLSYFFLLFLFFSFFLQQAIVFQFSSEINHIGYRCNMHHLCKTFFNGQSNEIVLFNAIETDLEEDISTLPGRFKEVRKIHLSIDEIQFRSLLKTKYLQLLSEIIHKPYEPLFVMQHAWKLAYT